MEDKTLRDEQMVSSKKFKTATSAEARPYKKNYLNVVKDGNVGLVVEISHVDAKAVVILRCESVEFSQPKPWLTWTII